MPEPTSGRPMSSARPRRRPCARVRRGPRPTRCAPPPRKGREPLRGRRHGRVPRLRRRGRDDGGRRRPLVRGDRVSAGFVPGPAHVPEVARTLVAGPHVAHLATVLPDGGPHVVPLWVGWEGDRLAFLTGPGSRKARNLARDPRVAVSVTETGNPYVMATLRGRVVEVLDDDAGWAVVDRPPRPLHRRPLPARGGAARLPGRDRPRDGAVVRLSAVGRAVPWGRARREDRPTSRRSSPPSSARATSSSRTGDRCRDVGPDHLQDQRPRPSAWRSRGAVDAPAGGWPVEEVHRPRASSPTGAPCGTSAARPP